MNYSRTERETLAVNRIVRDFANVRAHVPIVLIDGDSVPTVLGESAYYTTPSGKTVIAHPNAYKWPKLYHRSTYRVEVGRQWWEAARSLYRVAPLADGPGYLATCQPCRSSY